MNQSSVLPTIVDTLRLRLLPLFNSVTGDEQFDLRNLIKMFKLDLNQRLLLAQAMKTTVDIIECGLDGLHELFIFSAHSMPVSKNQCEKHFQR
jgi:hypothetical protein